MTDVHLVPHGEAWALKVGGDKREWFNSQDAAIRRDSFLGGGGVVIMDRGRFDLELRSEYR